MKASFKRIMYLCAGLVVLFIILVALPRDWKMSIGMTQAEYDKKIIAASDELLTATRPKERQSAAHKAQWLRKYEANGRIGETKDMTWVLHFFQFMIITAILLICWQVLKSVRIEQKKILVASEKSTPAEHDQM